MAIATVCLVALAGTARTGLQAGGATASSTLGQRYTVRKGDTVDSIANKLNMSPRALRRQLRKPLKAGAVLVITLPGGGGGSDLTGRIDNYRVKEGDTLRSIAAGLDLAEEELGDFNDLSKEVEVRAGDTLTSIGRRQGQSAAAIADWNDMTASDAVYPGMRLIVGWEQPRPGEVLYYPLRSAGVKIVQQELKAANGQYSDGSARLLSDQVRYELHSARAGETVGTIAKKRGASAVEIREINGLAAGEEPSAGEMLYVPIRAKKPDAGAAKPNLRLAAGQVPMRSGVIPAGAVILRSPGGARLYRTPAQTTVIVAGTWSGGYAVLMQGGRYGWIAQNSVQLGGHVASSQMTAAPASDARRLIEYAYTWIGTPYDFGGCSRKGVDCSAFVKNVYVSAGWWRNDAPRTAREQIKVGQEVSAQQLAPGDRIYFHTGRIGPGIADHTGIYIGGGQFIHSGSGRGVCVMPLFSGRYWRIYMTSRRDVRRVASVAAR